MVEAQYTEDNIWLIRLESILSVYGPMYIERPSDAFAPDDKYLCIDPKK